MDEIHRRQKAKREEMKRPVTHAACDICGPHETQGDHKFSVGFYEVIRRDESGLLVLDCGHTVEQM
jgi:hypothetical protein